jgi:hypothetical protein
MRVAIFIIELRFKNVEFKDFTRRTPSRPAHPVHVDKYAL